MAPEHLKLGAITLALMSIVFLAQAAIGWGKPGGDSPPEPAGRSTGRGGMILVMVSLLLLGGLWGLAEPAGWGRDRTLWVGFGAFLAVMTMTRPWWFWDNHRARWLRGLIGDEPTALLYLLLAGVILLGASAGSRASLAFMHPSHPSAPPGPEAFSGKGMCLEFQVSDAAAEYARFRDRGAPIELPLRDEPFGQRRFGMFDPAGVWIDVVEQIAPAPGWWDRYLTTPAET